MQKRGFNSHYLILVIVACVALFATISVLSPSFDRPTVTLVGKGTEVVSNVKSPLADEEETFARLQRDLELVERELAEWEQADPNTRRSKELLNQLKRNFEQNIERSVQRIVSLRKQMGENLVLPENVDPTFLLNRIRLTVLFDDIKDFIDDPKRSNKNIIKRILDEPCSEDFLNGILINKFIQNSNLPINIRLALLTKLMECDPKEAERIINLLKPEEIILLTEGLQEFKDGQCIDKEVCKAFAKVVRILQENHKNNLQKYLNLEDLVEGKSQTIKNIENLPCSQLLIQEIERLHELPELSPKSHVALLIKLMECDPQKAKEVIEHLKDHEILLKLIWEILVDKTIEKQEQGENIGAYIGLRGLIEDKLFPETPVQGVEGPIAGGQTRGVEVPTQNERSPEGKIFDQLVAEDPNWNQIIEDMRKSTDCEEFMSILNKNTFRLLVSPMPEEVRAFIVIKAWMCNKNEGEGSIKHILSTSSASDVERIWKAMGKLGTSGMLQTPEENQAWDEAYDFLTDLYSKKLIESTS